MKLNITFTLCLAFLLLITACDKKPDAPVDDRYKAEHAEQVKKTIRDYLGNGYRGYQYYANPDSVAAPLFDLSNHQNVEIISASSFKDRFASGETKSEFFDSFSANVSVSGIYEGFSGEITSNFSTATLRNRAHSFATSHITQKYYRISILDSAQLTTQAEEDLATLEPVALFEKYGTHYLKSIFIGGRVSFSTFIDRTRYSNKTGFQAAISAAYLDVVKGSGSGESKSNADVRMVATNKQLDVIGGDSAEANNVETGSGDPESSYNTWSRSVPANMSIADFADGGMVPLYELINDIERKSLITKAWQTYMEANTDDILKEAEPAIVTKNSAIKLQSADGRYIGKAPNKNAYYYPMMKTKGVKLVLGGSKDALKNNHNVTIKTSEKFKDKPLNPWSKRIYLGAFKNKHDLYYWTLYDAQTNWIFEKVIPSSDDKIRFGDTVRIKNEHYKDKNGYLIPETDGYLTTKVESHVWTILPGD